MQLCLCHQETPYAPVAILNILHEPDPRLRQKSAPVQEITPAVLKNVQDMKDTLLSEGNGVALAAPQVDIHKRIVVYTMDCFDPDEANNHQALFHADQPIAVMINPTITTTSADTVIEGEGCLSIPGVAVSLKRFKSIMVDFQDAAGAQHSAKVQGFLSRAIQHEIDHLDGILMFDHLPADVKKDVVHRYRLLEGVFG